MARYLVLLVMLSACGEITLAQKQPFSQPVPQRAAEIVRPQGPIASSEPIPLPPPGAMTKQGETEKASSNKPVFTVVSSLAIVLGLFCGFVWVSRKANVGKGGALSSDLFTVLGSSQIDPRNKTALLKCGNRVLLVAITQNGVNTLTEFSDAEEVNGLVAAATGKSDKAFATTLREINKSATVGEFDESTSTKKRHGLFGHGVS